MDASVIVRDYAAVREELLAFASQLFPAKDRSWREDLADEVIHRHLAGLSRGDYDFSASPEAARRRELLVLYKSLHHAGIDWVRREKARVKPGSLETRRPRGDPLQEVESALEARDAWEAYLATPTLTPRDREQLRLFFEEGWTAREIAASSGQEAAAVRKALSRAYRKIARHHFGRIGNGA
ncbi:MAG: sigma-70 family RNA polymerase sigma factor [Planctomycetes bacterium]|nr:sigma-70 family RNA polymerase sigma factor [Planctomycetota bacterium]